MRKPLKLNLGSGSNKIPGFINVDNEPTCKPDLLHDFINKKLPYKTDSVDEIVLFHCIEHICKPLHKRILTEMWRVLKPGSPVIISYPEFIRCFKNWKYNYRGKREFWEHTIFGRQLYPSDYHVCIMHTPEFIELLQDNGFTSITHNPEPKELHNTVVKAVKGPKPPNYEDLILSDMNNTTIIRS